MRRTCFYILFSGILALCLGSCGGNSPYTPRPTAAKEFIWGQIEDYGCHYDSIPLRVFSVDLYSDGLGLDSTGYMHGTGTNLYFSDVFTAPEDTMLGAGRYRASSKAQAGTFLPGMSFEGNYTGAYLLVVEESALSSITLLTDSVFDVTYTGDTLEMTFTLRQANGWMYKGHYKGVPQVKRH
ncbi:MAG: hypothetical protein IJ609_00135 [Paludibacteraceae bacterium]|nr:hypothetical protein [Paludibacteraceae bacterium]MBR1480329.1 hypothetical protein [Paludibacteraceae bacterium]